MKHLKYLFSVVLFINPGQPALADTAAQTSKPQVNVPEAEAALTRFTQDARAIMTMPIEKTDVPGFENGIFPGKKSDPLFDKMRDQFRAQLLVELRSNEQDANQIFDPTKYELKDAEEKTLVPLGEVTQENGKLTEELAQEKAVILVNDNPAILVEDLVEEGETLADVLVYTLDESDEYKEGQLKQGEEPWSDYYWPIYQGILGSRYNVVGWPGSTTEVGAVSASKHWPDYRDFNNASLLQTYSDGRNLSPAEKYAWLVGAEDIREMADQHAKQAQRYFDASSKDDDKKEVATWMGICHGWAPAAFMEQRPTTAFDAVAADGRKIRFYPSDLKSLSSLAWANITTESKFVGSRCNKAEAEEQIAKDEMGRVTDQECFDNNPGSWHQVITTRLGKKKKTFIMDATFDAEVWNQPVYAYQFEWFNPSKMKVVPKLSDAKELLVDLPEDQFLKHGHRDSTIKMALGLRQDQDLDKTGKAYRETLKEIGVVGVVMTVWYTVETPPNNNETDSAANDALKQVQYIYDLEYLASNNQIIGGEWYTNQHPDFLWTPAKGVKARHLDEAAILSYSDVEVPEVNQDFRWLKDTANEILNWDPSKEPVPAFWGAVAHKNVYPKSLISVEVWPGLAGYHLTQASDKEQGKGNPTGVIVERLIAQSVFEGLKQKSLGQRVETDSGSKKSDSDSGTQLELPFDEEN